MAIDYDEARQHAEACIDAFNRHDLDAYMAQLHDEITHGSTFVDVHAGQEDSFVNGKQAHREYVAWLWDQEPTRRTVVLLEVLVGPHGYAFLTRLEPDGWQVVWVREIGADGLVRSQRLYRSRTPEG